MDLTWHYFDIPLREPFRGVARRKGAVAQGPRGWGETSPFPGFGWGSEADGAASALSSMFEEWPEPVRHEVPVHVTVPALDPEAAAARVRESGCSAAKVKVAQGDDEARVEAVRDALGPAGRLVIDANAAWGVQQAIQAIRRLSRYSVDLVEQPVRGFVEMAKVRRRVDVPLAADELASSEAAIRRIVDAEAADVLVIKVQQLGGVANALRVLETADLPAVISSLLETSVGLSAGLALAAALPELPFPCGLGTADLLGGDLVAEPLFPVDGVLKVRRPEPDPGLLARWADPDPGSQPPGDPRIWGMGF